VAMRGVARGHHASLVPSLRSFPWYVRDGDNKYFYIYFSISTILYRYHCDGWSCTRAVSAGDEEWMHDANTECLLLRLALRLLSPCSIPFPYQALPPNPQLDPSL
jgi:hypothetical protein